VIGVLAWTGLLSWFGRMPGDIRIVRDNVRVYVPIASMILVSVVVSLVLWLGQQGRGGHQQTGHRRYAEVTGFGHQWHETHIPGREGHELLLVVAQRMPDRAHRFVREVSRAYGRGLRI
jgi:hypothetical protein